MNKIPPLLEDGPENLGQAQQYHAAVTERNRLRKLATDLAETLRVIDGTAQFKTATGRDTEAWTMVRDLAKHAVARATKAGLIP